MQNNCPSFILEKIFESFESNGLSYCVLRNYENLPNAVDGDIDILIRPEQVHLALDLLKIFCEKYSAFPVFYMKLGTHIQVQIYGRNHSVEPYILALDFQTGLSYKGMTYLSADFIFKKTTRFNGYIVPEPEVYWLLLVLHSVIDKGFFKEKYRQKVSLLFPENRQLIDDIVSKIFSLDVKNELLSSMIIYDFDKILALKYKVLFDCVSFLQVKEFLKYCIDINKDRLHRVLSLRGVFVVLLGPDGAGKTTITEQINSFFSKNPGLVKKIYLGSKRQLISNELKKRLNINQTSSNGIFRSVFAVLYHCFRYFLTYCREVLPFLFRRGTVLGDRYYYDLLVTDYYQIPGFLLKLLIRVMPNPDLVILLTNDPDKIYQRKKEKSVSEISMQLQKYRNIGQYVSGWSEVSTELMVQNTVEIVLDKIMHHRKVPWIVLN